MDTPLAEILGDTLDVDAPINGLFFLNNFDESDELEEISYYEWAIRNHLHVFEGIYLVNYDKSGKLIYSDLYIIEKILISSKNSKAQNIGSRYTLSLTKDESRYFDFMSLKNKSICEEKDCTYTLLLSTGEPSKNSNARKTRRFAGGNRNKLRRKTKVRYVQKGGVEIPHSRIVYKYQDPVIRMCCEYMILFNNIFKTIDSSIIIATYAMPDFSVKEHTLTAKLESIWRDMAAGEPLRIDDPESGLEGSKCEFGIGAINCCNKILREKHLDELLVKLTDFQCDAYTATASEVDYNQPPFIECNIPYAADLYLKKKKKTAATLSPPDQFKLLQINILQMVIDKIIFKSGREGGYGAPAAGAMGGAGGGGGAAAAAPGERYPKIHLLEILDPANEVWMMRCERHHLSKSPCVHLGIEDSANVDNFLISLNLYDPGKIPFTMPSIAWLHTIGHALDRIYCGHNGFSQLGNRRHGHDQHIIFAQLVEDFQFFYDSMGRPPILQIFDNTDPKINKIFFYYCVKEKEGLHTIINAYTEPALNVLIGKLSTIAERTILASKSKDEKQLYLNSFIDRLLDSEHKFNYAYAYDLAGDRFTIKPTCAKKVHDYSCRTPIGIAERAFIDTAL